MKYLKDSVGKIRAAIDAYGMIKENDVVCAAVSGGKDSLFLLWSLSEIKKYYPIKFDLKAITLDPLFYGRGSDWSAIASFCSSIGVSYAVRESPLWEIVFETRKEKNPCSLCSRMRRGILHGACVEHGGTSVALGHHSDDAAQTFFMNLLNGGRAECFSPTSYLSRRNINVIRPMIFCTAAEISRAAARLGLPVTESPCPANRQTNREETKALLFELEKKYPKLRKKIISALRRGHINGW